MHWKSHVIGLVTACLVALGTFAGPDVAHAQDGTHLVVATNQEPDSVDLLQSRYQPSARPTMANVFDALISIDSDGNPVPGVAEWEISDDSKTITFHINEGVLFHSGDELTAEDVVFSHERMMEHQPSYPRQMSKLESVEVVDRYTVRFTFTEPDARFIPNRMPYLVSKAYHEHVGEEQFVDQPVGTGPYRLTSYNVGEDLTLERFEDYWGEQPEVSGARFVFADDDNQRVSMLRAGEADIVMSVPFWTATTLEEEGYDVIAQPAHPTLSVRFGLLNDDVPYADPRVRKAIAHAIDRNAIIENVLQGWPERFTRLAPGEVGYDPELEDYVYDPARARGLLAEAGYSDGFDMRVT